MILPIAERKLFVAGDTPTTVARIANKTDKDLGRIVNRSTDRHARNFVYGANERQLRFVQNQMGTSTFTSLMESVERKRLKAPPLSQSVAENLPGV